MRWAVAAALALGAAALLAGCGGGSGGSTSSEAGTSTDQSALRFPRTPSVTYQTTPPAIAASVRQAAARAGCTVKAFPMEPVQVQSDGTYHTTGPITYHVSLPPTSGLHYPIWADWGVYDVPVPFRFQVHNLEHGGIIIHEGTGLTSAQKAQITALWREAPPYVLVTPETFAQFPKDAVVVTSWQRWMVCRPYTAKALAAIRVYRNVYRGTGPEQIAAVNSGQADQVDGLPSPAIPDAGAVQ
jgi:Protein of unknown function (DUF3105)